MTTRIIQVLIEMACCRDGEEAYHPLPREIISSQNKKYFKRSALAWKLKAEEMIYNKYRQIAEDECDAMGTPRLCFFKMTTISFKVYGGGRLRGNKI